MQENICLLSKCIKPDEFRVMFDYKTNQYDIAAVDLNELFSHYVMASYLYYEVLLNSPWSDAQFDQSCQRLLEEWDDITHPEKALTSLDSLQAGTGFAIKFSFMAKCSALHWYGEHNNLNEEQLASKAREVIADWQTKVFG